MRICIITGNFPFSKCGVGDYTNILCDNLFKLNKVDIDVITSKDQEIKKTDYKVWNIINDWTFSDYKIIKAKLKDIKPDIIHVQYPTKLYKRNLFINLLPALLQLQGYKVITTIHEYSENTFLGKVREWPNIIFSDGIIVVDPIYKDELLSNLLFKRKLIEHINVGPSIMKSSLNANEKNKLKTKIAGDVDCKLIGYFGFINPKKGLDSIIKALKKVKENSVEKFKLLIIGDLLQDDLYHKEILDLISELNLEDDIHITGYVSNEEVGQLLSIVDCTVLPFLDGLSVKNTSFLAAVQENSTIITTQPKHRSMPSFSNVYYVNRNKNVDEIYAKIVEIVSRNSNNLKNDKEVDNCFSWNNICNKHYDLYKNIMK